MPPVLDLDLEIKGLRHGLSGPSGHGCRSFHVYPAVWKSSLGTHTGVSILKSSNGLRSMFLVSQHDVQNTGGLYTRVFDILDM